MIGELILGGTNGLFEKLWKRHRNPISWVLRPVFGIVWFYGAWIQNIWIVLFCVFGLATSWFWFPEPKESPRWVLRFLEIEKEYVTPPWTYKKVVPFGMIFVFLGLFTWVLWFQDLILGAAILIFGFFFKAIWSYIVAKDSGLPITILSISALGILSYIVYILLQG
ncbi:hypothetical protein EU528_11975 [Candidatus Thorarchaeota archaeon]|nr:MAG: hypothetical protein EU528_11975 [Candidatus Thorarchaeota archaeon]